MGLLVRQRCLHHPERQAVARCPGCGSFHCRECITEHEGRVLCAECLKQLLKPKTKEGRKAGLLPARLMAAATRSVAVFVGVFLLWLFFYCSGKVLVSIPASFHDGTLWKPGAQEDFQ